VAPTRVTSGATTSASSVPNLSSSITRPKIKIPVWVITHERGLTRTFWTKEKCLGTSLSEFVTGISQATQRRDIEEIKFTLNTPIRNTRFIISKDAEDIWEFAKKTFTEELKKVRAELKEKMGDCDITIESIY
jgi:hypothetical protein